MHSFYEKPLGISGAEMENSVVIPIHKNLVGKNAKISDNVMLTVFNKLLNNVCVCVCVIL